MSLRNWTLSAAVGDQLAGGPASTSIMTVPNSTVPAGKQTLSAATIAFICAVPLPCFDWQADVAHGHTYMRKDCAPVSAMRA